MIIEELYKIFQNNPIICTDTRKISKGSIFFALKGENFNGNEFSNIALSKGCSYAIIDQKEYVVSNKTIYVKDVLATLQNLAKYHRKKLTIPVIGITGTNGKTTSKELVSIVLNSEKKCYATAGNLNNHIGVPLSILEIDASYDIAIIEMGANHQGEIKFLCDICQPSHGVITNIGSAHLEGFGSEETIINTKNELYQYIHKTKGLIFTNEDDNLLNQLSNNIKKITYGKKGQVYGKILSTENLIKIKYLSHDITTNLVGDFQFYNIMLAICVGNYFKISIKNIKKSIQNFIPKNNRSQSIKTKYNQLILDAYNANPSSMEAMLISFSKNSSKNKICVLGDMLELGIHSTKEHKKIIKLCSKLNLTCYFIGGEFNKIKSSFFKSREEFEKYLKENKIINKTILIKGSRGIELEKIIPLL